MVRFVLLVLCSVAAFAQHDAESLHITNVEISLSKRLLLQAHTRLRTRNEYREFFQARLGPILNFQVNRRVTAIGGYYLIDQRYRKSTGQDWEDFSRYFGGTSVQVYKRPSLAVDWRGLIERFHSIPGGDFTRVRNRATLTKTWSTWQTFGTFEVLYAQNTPTVRIGTGLNRRLSRNLLMGFGYEFRQYSNGTKGHIIVTNTTFQTGRKD